MPSKDDKWVNQNEKPTARQASLCAISRKRGSTCNKRGVALERPVASTRS